MLTSKGVFAVFPNYRLCTCHFTHKAFEIWLNFWYQNLHMFKKCWGDKAVDQNKHLKSTNTHLCFIMKDISEVLSQSRVQRTQCVVFLIISWKSCFTMENIWSTEQTMSVIILCQNAVLWYFNHWYIHPFTFGIKMMDPKHMG